MINPSAKDFNFKQLTKAEIILARKIFRFLAGYPIQTWTGQKQFHDEVLQPLLQKAEKGKCHVLFLDSAHFVLAAFVAMVWCFERVFVKTAPGRFRLNVIGAIHATNLQLTAIGKVKNFPKRLLTVGRAK